MAYTPDDFINDSEDIDNLELFSGAMEDMTAEELENLSDVVRTKKTYFNGNKSTLNAVQNSRLIYNAKIWTEKTDAVGDAVTLNSVIRSIPLFLSFSYFLRKGSYDIRTSTLIPLSAINSGNVSENVVTVFGTTNPAGGTEDKVKTTGKDNQIDYLWNYFDKKLTQGKPLHIDTIRFLAGVENTELISKLRQASISIFTVSPMGSISKNNISLAGFVEKKQYQDDIIDIPLGISLKQNQILTLDIQGFFSDTSDVALDYTVFLK